MFDAMSPASRRAVGFREAAPLFAALGDQTRLQLLDRLCHGGPSSTARLRAGLPVSHQAISKHLEVLHAAGLVRSSRRGRERIWDLEPKRLGAAHAYLDRISEQWDDALERLKKFIEH